jgi:opacity protein-like surface antigen
VGGRGRLRLQVRELVPGDVTADHRFYADFEGQGSLASFGPDSRRDRGKLESTSGLVNGYLDLGNWSGITPYVGAGIGAAMNRLSDYHLR